MTTVMVWLGSGFAFAVGTLLGITAFGFAARRGDKQTGIANQYLAERNDISWQQLEVMRDICDSLRNMEDK